MKKVLIEKLDSFAAAPFTIQRISELLSDPRKQYSRIDKFMRAVEKTILVVSTVPPGRHRSESENGDSLDSALNGDFATEVNVDVEMEHEGTTAKELTDGYQRPVVATAEPETTATDKKVSQPTTEVGETSKESETKLSPVEPPKKIESVVVADKPKEEPLRTDEKQDVPETLSVISSPTKEETKPEAAVAQEPIVAVAPKAQDDELSNKPIQPADNEILVNASEMPSEPTPLAALENIVAIRAETIEVTETIEEQILVETEKTTSDTSRVEEVVPVQIVAEQEEAETETKRLKISESVDVPKVEEKTEEVVVEAPAAASPTVAEILEPTVVPPAEVPIVSLPIVEIPEVKPTIEQAVAAESIAEHVPVVVEIPIEVAPTTEEAPATEMETVSTVTENTMSLDEDEPPIIELEMTPIASKMDESRQMDTDEAEAAPMDCEDEAEPMDQ